MQGRLGSRLQRSRVNDAGGRVRIARGRIAVRAARGRITGRDEACGGIECAFLRSIGGLQMASQGLIRG